MVRIHAKGVEEKDQFLYETTVNILIEVLKKELIEIYNFRNKILKLANASIDLAEHGPLRPEQFRGLSEEELKLHDYNISKEAINPDKNNFRTGIPPPHKEAKQLKEISRHVIKQLSLEKIEKNISINLNILNEYLNSIVNILKLCYPNFENLPSYDTTRLLIEQENLFENDLIYDETSLWWAGKELDNKKYLKDLIGKNEKTKLIIKIQPTKFGAPVREPRIDKETYKAMLSYYHKKQKEEKEFEEDDDDSYLNSEWANPLYLQKQLHGNLTNIKWKP